MLHSPDFLTILIKKNNHLFTNLVAPFSHRPGHPLKNLNRRPFVCFLLTF
jgi:hypothetical protein